MKKKIFGIILIIVGVLILFFSIKALNSNSKNDKVTIYMFRGQGCPHCEDFLHFLNEMEDEYKDMFELQSYEVWYDTDNRDLMDNISSFLGDNVSGVPYIIIGDKTFAGYGSGYDTEIKSTIKSLYNAKKSKRYDVLTEYKKKNKLTKKYKSLDFKDTLEQEGISYKKSNGSSSISTTWIIIWNFIFTAIATSTIIMFINKKFKELNSNIVASTKKTTKITKK